MVTIKADLLHFQSAPSASESCIGGVDLIGAKVAAQASVKNASMSKGRFIAILLFPVSAGFATLPDPVLVFGYCYQALVSTCLRGRGKWLRPMEQIISWPARPTIQGLRLIDRFGITKIQDAGFRCWHETDLKQCPQFGR